MTFELATLLMFLNVNLRLILSSPGRYNYRVDQWSFPYSVSAPRGTLKL